MAQVIPEDECARAIEFFRNQVTCEWCQHPRKAVMPMTRLCRHCNRIRLGLVRLETANRGRETYDVRVQREMVADCQFEGRLYGRFFDDDLLPLGLEHEFRDISQRFVNEDLYNGMANNLNHSFSLNQRRYLFYLLSLMSRERLRKTRRRRAMMAAIVNN